ncbi:DsrE/DsrF/DrsH-like family protein [Metallosphaera hakonensis]|uniref:Peroxiredoxin n=1 Tax=Metallosphaera hakonensis JCM 8857 = DSM 7519 TaxID=1293036 RepID=A0A2U9IVI5_9CREN|nr:DsrE/DsrF/DrsH-like family protein [Metallosphaera hakonensis]AWS00070.1 peroxiredoxin [Metallosphaera hakonensis JCM 8857 = DSM 7519]
MSKLTILLADNSMDKLYHGLVLALDARSLDWSVKFFVTSQAVSIFTKKFKGKSKLRLGFLARLFVSTEMKRMGLPDPAQLIDEAIKEGVEFYVDEVGLKIAHLGREDLLDNVKLSGGITYLKEAQDSDVVVTL